MKAVVDSNNALRRIIAICEEDLPPKDTRTPRQLAEAFCEMSDEEQAQFFIEAADVASYWEQGNVDQWYMVGRHLRTCSCSNDNARYLVQRIATGIGEQ